jgi:glycosyltransferase involved in cell wall biosynthesis
MKILQVIPFFSPEFGGSVTVLYDLSRKLARRNHEVTILTTDFGFDREYADQIRKEGVTVIALPCVAYIGLFLYSPSINTWSEENLKKFDTIHLHNYRSYQNAVIRTFAMKYRIPYIIQAHGSVPPLFHKEFLKKCFDRVWGYKILIDAAICIASTEIESDQYEKMGVSKNKIIIVPNGIDLSQYVHLPLRGQFRSKYKIPEDVRIILTLGRIHKIKGIDLLVKAFSQISHEFNNVKLVIAGPDGGSLSQIQQQIHELQIDDKVLFTGPLYEEEKIEAFTDADIFVFPSRYDSFGNTLLEAWMFELPVIVTTNCCISSVIKDSNTGIVVDFDPAQIHEQILYLLNNEEKRKELGIMGKKFVQHNYEIKKIVRIIEEIYASI